MQAALFYYYDYFFYIFLKKDLKYGAARWADRQNRARRAGETGRSPSETRGNRHPHCDANSKPIDGVMWDWTDGRSRPLF